MTKITFYGVVDEIGGNKILIEDETKKGIAEDFIEKATERTQIMTTTIFASFAFFAVRFLDYPNKSEIFLIFLCVLSDLCGFSNKIINQSLKHQRKQTQKELKPCN